jgi:hypothetical protein
LHDEGNLRTIQGIPRVVIVREISALQLKKSYRKGCQIFVAHMEETPKNKVSNIEDYAILKEFEDVFKEIPGLAPKRDIDFSNNLMLGATLVSKTPYRMSTPELKKLQMHLEEGIYTPKCVTLGCPNIICEEKGWNIETLH